MGWGAVKPFLNLVTAKLRAVKPFLNSVTVELGAVKPFLNLAGRHHGAGSARRGEAPADEYRFSFVDAKGSAQMDLYVYFLVCLYIIW